MIRLAIRGRHGVVAHALLDDEDGWALDHRWHLSGGHPGRRYARRAPTRGEYHYLHREIVGAPEGLQVDHINGDRLDNRRENLRVVTPGENLQNINVAQGASRHRGVSKHNNGKWYARVQIAGKIHNLGCFADEDEAGRVAAEFRAKHMPFSADARKAAA